MKIQPISMVQQPNFYASLPKPKTSVHPSVIPKRDGTQETNFVQAIMVGLVFFAASLTKTLIDKFKSSDEGQAVVEAPAVQQTVTPDAKTFQLK